MTGQTASGRPSGQPLWKRRYTGSVRPGKQIRVRVCQNCRTARISLARCTPSDGLITSGGTTISPSPFRPGIKAQARTVPLSDQDSEAVLFRNRVCSSVRPNDARPLAQERCSPTATRLRPRCIVPFVDAHQDLERSPDGAERLCARMLSDRDVTVGRKHTLTAHAAPLRMERYAQTQKEWLSHSKTGPHCLALRTATSCN